MLRAEEAEARTRWTGSEGAQLGTVRAVPAAGRALRSPVVWMLQLLCSALERDRPLTVEQRRTITARRALCQGSILSATCTHTHIHSWQAVPAMLEAKAMDLQRPKNTLRVREHSTLQPAQAAGQGVIWGRGALCRNQARIRGVSEDIGREERPSSTRAPF